MSRPNLVYSGHPLPLRWLLSFYQTAVPLKLAALLVLVAGVAGCQKREEVRRYQAPKVTAVAESGNGDADAAGATDRMLAAIALHDDKAWFFKMTGPKDAVQEQAESFRGLIQSLTFEGGRPQWTLPEGWREEAGTGIRFATLKAKADGANLEVSVTSLPRHAGDDDRAYYLANINRWRGQLQLGPLSADALPDESEQIDFTGGRAIYVDIVGKSSSNAGMGRPPFAGADTVRRPEPNGSATSSNLKFDKPEGWEDGELVVSRGGITLTHEAAFTATDGDQQVEITVDRLPPVGSTLANVNRWRRQVGLPPQDEAAYRESVKQIEMAGKERDYVQLIGPDETILGVIAEHDGQAWFIKLKGDNDLAEAQRERFEAFVNSIRVD